ncbi:MAG: glycosyltransferase family 39 protein [Paludibacteraceae bacterium]
MIDHYPISFANKAIVYYIAVVALVSLLWFRYRMDLQFVFFGVLEVSAFFYFAAHLPIRWRKYTPVAFVKQLFWVALGIRVVYVIFSYFYYNLMTGKPFEYGSADAWIYHLAAQDMARFMRGGNFNIPEILVKAYGSEVGLSDSGYPTYLAFVYYLSGSSVMVARLLKALWSAFTCVLMYRIAARNFGEPVARMTGIFCLLMPNLIYYCGLHLKETEMLFLVAATMDMAEQLLRTRKFNIWLVLPLALGVFALLTMRTVLGGVMAIAILMAFVLSSSRVAGWGRRIAVGILVLGMLGLVFNEQITAELNQTYQDGRAAESQQRSMSWRAETNRFAKYAGAAVFAPLIFTIPFPTLVDVDQQYNQQLINGGNYVKGLLSFFVIFAFVMLVFGKSMRKGLYSDSWRNHVLPIAFVVGYLIVLVFSSFAQSERFHIPVLPFELMFAAYGLTLLTKKDTKMVRLWYAGMFVAIVGWSWFKLAGRGLT